MCVLLGQVFCVRVVRTGVLCGCCSDRCSVCVLSGQTTRTQNTTQQQRMDGFQSGTNNACLQRHGQTAHRQTALTQTYATEQYKTCANVHIIVIGT